MKASGRLREAAETQFVEVKLPSPATVAPSAAGDTRVEVRLTNGRSLRVGPGFDTEHVRALLGVVRGWDMTGLPSLRTLDRGQAARGSGPRLALRNRAASTDVGSRQIPPA